MSAFNFFNSSGDKNGNDQDAIPSKSDDTVNNNLSYELLDLERWKEDAAELQEQFYQRFAGNQWFKYYPKDSELLVTRLCISTFGFVPGNVDKDIQKQEIEEEKIDFESLDDHFDEYLRNAEIIEKNDDNVYLLNENGESINIDESVAKKEKEEVENAVHDLPQMEKAFSDEQRKMMIKIKDKIFEVGKNPHDDNAVTMFTIFVICKCGDNDFRIPVFRVLTGCVGGKDSSKFVDTEGRIYSDFEDWKKNNKLFPMDYCYPKNGVYTCDENGEYDFDIIKPPVLEFGQSPAAGLASKIAGIADKTSAVGSLGSGALFITSMAMAVNPIALTVGAVVGAVTAVYGGVRISTHLFDKKTHGEDMADFDSVVCYISLAALPLNFATSITNNILTQGAQAGRTFSATTRGISTGVLWSSIVANAAMLIGAVVNLNEKRKNKQITALDVLQFSMSVFFFSNMVMQPKTAAAVIKRAQHEHIDSFKGTMSEEQKVSYEEFVKNNQAEGGNIAENAKIIKTVNKIQNAGEFFESVKGGNAVIGGKKGNTVLVKNDDSSVARIRTKDMSTVEYNKMDAAVFESHVRNIRTASVRDIQIAGEGVFEYSSRSPQMKALMSSAMQHAGHHRAQIFYIAERVADHFNVKVSGNYWYIVEIIIIYQQGKGEKAWRQLRHFFTTNGFWELINDMKRDVAAAMELSEKAAVSLKNRWETVYYYLKYGKRFTYLFSGEFHLYIDEAANKLAVQSTGLIFHSKHIKCYSRIVNDNLEFIVVQEIGSKRSIATTFPVYQFVPIFDEKLTEIKASENVISLDQAIRKLRAQTRRDSSIYFHFGEALVESVDSFKQSETAEMLQHAADMLSALTPE